MLRQGISDHRLVRSGNDFVKTPEIFVDVMRGSDPGRSRAVFLRAAEEANLDISGIEGIPFVF